MLARIRWCEGRTHGTQCAALCSASQALVAVRRRGGAAGAGNEQIAHRDSEKVCDDFGVRCPAEAVLSAGDLSRVPAEKHGDVGEAPAAFEADPPYAPGDAWITWDVPHGHTPSELV